MIKEQFIQVENTEKFKEQLENGEISNQSIAFLKDTNQIWTQDKYYHCDDVLDDSGKIKKELLDRAIDLSYRDINGNVLATQNTANCYVIKEPGTYKFPLVYGNAIKNGKVNTAAYTNIEPDNENMGDFVNVDGNPISNPWIEKDLGVSLSPNYNYITGLDNVYISEGYAYFTFQPGSESFNSEGSFHSFVVNKGNETTFDEEGYIEDRVAWQWIIWYYPQELYTIDITNATGVKYQMLSDNLAGGYDSPWFAFGRYSMVTSVYTVEVTDMSQLIATPCDYATYYAVGSEDHNTLWSSGNSRCCNYWNAAQNNFGVSDINVVKTVYDPCPVGFVVPPASAFSGMTILTRSSTSAEGNFTRFSGDTEGIFLYGQAMPTFPAGGTFEKSTIALLTSSEVYSSHPAYFWVSQTEVDYIHWGSRTFLAQIRPIAEN